MNEAIYPLMTDRPGALSESCAPVVVLIDHSLEKSEQKVSEILEQLKASQIRENAISEAKNVDKAASKEAIKRLESRVSSLEGDLGRSRESWVV